MLLVSGVYYNLYNVLQDEKGAAVNATAPFDISWQKETWRRPLHLLLLYFTVRETVFRLPLTAMT